MPRIGSSMRDYALLFSSNPAQRSTGSRGYFGYSGSRNERRHIINRVPRSLRVSFLCRHRTHKPISPVSSITPADRTLTQVNCPFCGPFALKLNHTVNSSEIRRQALADALATRILVLDGAMGTMLQASHLTAADFGGVSLEG